MAEGFDYEHDKWASGQADVARRWYDELESTGVENVRARLAQTDAGSAGAIMIGSEMIVIGFAQHWLAWHDRQRAEREASFRQWQIFWSRWTALAATATALAVAIGWIVTFALIRRRSRKRLRGASAWVGSLGRIT
jgi:di/tricarboxylate transporter